MHCLHKTYRVSNNRVTQATQGKKKDTIAKANKPIDA